MSSIYHSSIDCKAKEKKPDPEVWVVVLRAAR